MSVLTKCDTAAYESGKLSSDDPLFAPHMGSSRPGEPVTRPASAIVRARFCSSSDLVMRKLCGGVSLVIARFDKRETGRLKPILRSAVGSISVNPGGAGRDATE